MVTVISNFQHVRVIELRQKFKLVSQVTGRTLQDFEGNITLAGPIPGMVDDTPTPCSQDFFDFISSGNLTQHC